MFNKKRLIICLLFIFLNAYSEVSTSIDTVDYLKVNGNKVKLNNQFIIESSLSINGEINPVFPITIFPISGYLLLPDTLQSQKLVVKYKFLPFGLPTSIGPKWKLLPQLNQIMNNTTSLKSKNEIYHQKDNHQVFTSGVLHRRMEIKPLGGSDFTGGLQMQLNGNLFNDISISGVLTDQSLPFQPEGITQKLEDLDNVYLNINHPNFNLNAGDILFKNNNINRKLVGLNTDFNFDALSGSTVYATSQGTFNYLEIKGRDGDQGPYQLIGKDGNPDILVLSGTEKIWVNGKKLIRGKNYDYTIDYSTAEVIFTPRVMIDFDTDIMFEYQYSDFQYQQDFIGGNMKKESDRLYFDIGVYKESDRYQSQDMNAENFDILSNISGNSAIVPTAVYDKTGDYILVNNIYKYSPIINSNDTIRYQVLFHFDENGKYIRKISDINRIYYEYVSEENRYQYDNYYSPYKYIYAPKVLHFGYLDYKYQVNKDLFLYGKLSGSILNQNILANKTTKQDVANNIGLEIDSIDIGPGYMNLRIKNWVRGPKYNSLGRENDILYTRLWNLDSSITQGILQNTIETDYTIKNFGKSYLQISELKFDDNKFSRNYFEQKLLNKFFYNSYYKYLIINDNQEGFIRSDARLQLNIKSLYKPFVSLLSEDDPETGRFWKTGMGFDMEKNDRKITTAIHYRQDQFYVLDEPEYQTTKDVVGHFQYDKKTKSGYKQNIVYKKRIKIVQSDGDNYDYSLFNIDIGTYKDRQPFRWMINLRKEESLVQQYATVYDSIGFGLGNYRYDTTFNTYVSDPNGAYIAYNVISGNRTRNTSFIGSQKLTLDLNSLPFISNATIRINSKQEFQGISPNFQSLFQSKIEDSKTRKSNVFYRIEAFLTDNRKIMLWSEKYQVLNGLDMRGNEMNISSQTGIDLTKHFYEDFSIRNLLTLKSFDIKSRISDLRNRESSGLWNDLQLQYTLNHWFNLNIGLLFGTDVGIQQNSSFSGQARGLKLSSRILFKETGRLQTEVVFMDVHENNNFDYLPPESLDGYPLGKTFRTNTRIQYLLNRSVSMILSINTINDNRYNNFITIQGELRAYF